MKTTRAQLLALLALVALWAVMPARTSAANGSVWVAVTGPPDGNPPEELVLEIGATSWFGYGGVASVESAAPLHVRLVGRGSCRVYSDFQAPANSNWLIRFAADGTVRLEDWTNRAMDSGPALTPRAPSGCAVDPPLTEAPSSRAPESSGLGIDPIVVAAVFLGLILILGVATIAFARRRQSR